MILEFKKGANEKVSEHFNSSEFDCHCVREDCDRTYISEELIRQLEAKRKYAVCKPIKIVSGYRCESHNRSVGGKKGSYHQIGKAVDIAVDGMSHKELQTLMQTFDGLGCGANLTNVDVRGYPARWRY